MHWLNVLKRQVSKKNEGIILQIGKHFLGETLLIVLFKKFCTALVASKSQQTLLIFNCRVPDTALHCCFVTQVQDAKYKRP